MFLAEAEASHVRTVSAWHERRAHSNVAGGAGAATFG
jgi:hypothetical protein